MTFQDISNPTFWHTERGHDGLYQTQHVEGAAAHISKEEHETNTATKLWTQRSADHVWGGGVKAVNCVCVSEFQALAIAVGPDIWQPWLCP